MHAATLPFLPDLASSTLAVIDIQERLLPAMEPTESARFLRAATLLVSLYAELGGDLIATEQYPRGLGPTVPAIASLLPQRARVFEKRAFSALREPTDVPLAFKPDVVVIGMEAHVCVLQTTVDLLARGHRVFVVDDGVISRVARDAATGRAFMRDAGARIIGAETLVFAALERAEGETFKRFSAAIR